MRGLENGKSVRFKVNMEYPDKMHCNSIRSKSTRLYTYTVCSMFSSLNLDVSWVDVHGCPDGLQCTHVLLEYSAFVKYDLPAFSSQRNT